MWTDGTIFITMPCLLRTCLTRNTLVPSSIAIQKLKHLFILEQFPEEEREDVREEFCEAMVDMMEQMRSRQDVSRAKVDPMKWWKGIKF